MTLNGDRVLGVCLIVLAVAYGWGAQQWPPPFGGQEAIGPQTFPTILSVILALSSLYLIFRPDPDHPWPGGKTALELIYAVLTLIAYAFMLEPIGFIPTTTAAVGFLCWRMGARLRPALLTGLISAVVVFFLFNNLLQLSLPAGILALPEG